MGISVWLVPSEPESAILQRLMARHPEPGEPDAQRQASFPHFHPHVTLATVPVPVPVAAPAALPLPPPPCGAPTTTSPGPGASNDDQSADAERAETLLALREAVPLGQRAVRVRFARVLAGDHYFRSIYVALVPSRELAGLRAALALARCRGPGRPGPDEPPAFPHLSLYYVADGEAHVRARLLQELEREDVVRHSADGLGVALRCAEGGGDGGGGGGGVLEGFTGTQMWIVDCVGPVEGWKVLDKILLPVGE
ncbi:hypothetical protein F5148DRAFT_1151037 [Russula earlei]|uniref:Uncharacterized protein n=1 Tax=Russula earlei TaxID=71964 RepID=A0ACC0U431_9AGAM|nr:hypothetical protein F5148DRAFT_1151037 [Russula earlei]